MRERLCDYWQSWYPKNYDECC